MEVVEKAAVSLITRGSNARPPEFELDTKFNDELDAVRRNLLMEKLHSWLVESLTFQRVQKAASPLVELRDGSCVLRNGAFPLCFGRKNGAELNLNLIESVFLQLVGFISVQTKDGKGISCEELFSKMLANEHIRQVPFAKFWK